MDSKKNSYLKVKPFDKLRAVSKVELLKLDAPKKASKLKSLLGTVICLILLLSQLSFSQKKSEEKIIFEYPVETPKVDLKTQKFLETLSSDSSVAVWVFFKDKGIKTKDEYNTALSLCVNQISERSLKRRMLRGRNPGLDFTDIPVNKPYLDELESIGVKIRVISRWLNSASVMANKSQIERIESLPFVRSIKKVVTFIRSKPLEEENQLRKTGGTKEKQGLGYGESDAQLTQIHVPELHHLGYSGKGVLITMLDTGFWLHHPAFDSILNSNRLIAMHDFINGDEDVEDGSGDGQRDHGTCTFSAVGGFVNDALIGPAYGAEFALAKTEVTATETKIEEDYWIAGLWWADSVGADVVSSSLGYNDWYTYKDMDGKTALCTIAADLAVSKGIVVVNAAGNERTCSHPPCWNYIIAPADGDSVIAVGAVDLQGKLAVFSSVGPTYDKRIKPDVVACGVSTYCASAYGGYTRVGGTSLSTPLVAGVCALLLEIHPEWKPSDIINALHTTSSQASHPDTLMGYGLVNAAKATGFSYLVISPEELFFEASFGDTQSQQKTLSVANWQGEGLKWNAHTDADWITLLPDSGFTSDLFWVIVHPSRLKTGINRDSILISSSGAINSPQKVPVVFTLHPATSVRTFPNPFTDSLTVVVEKPDIASKVTVYVFTVAGELVCRFPKKDEETVYEQTWDGKNDKGEEVGSGIYLLKIDIDDHPQIVKVAKIK